MTKANLFLSAAILAGVAAFAPGADAKPVAVGYSTGGAITTLDSGNGSAGVTADIVSGFSVTLQAVGTTTPSTPFDMNAPDFGSNTLTISSTQGGSITLYASESNNNKVVPSFTLGFSNNPQSTTSVTESFYASSGNQLFGLTTLLGSETLAPGRTITDIAPFGALNTPYSITEVYTITFGEGGGKVNATILESANVPEPVSLSLLGAGLAGLGMVRLRRKA